MKQLINLDNSIVLKEELLKQLNNAIDITIDEKQRMRLDYEWLEAITGKMTQNKRANRRRYKTADVIMSKIPKPVQLSTISTSEMVKLAVDFFKSVDEDIYKLAVETILQQKEKISTYIYNIHNVKNFSETEENGIIKYDIEANVMYDNGEAIVHMPIGDKKNKNSGNICSIDDSYALVHEIAHLFDANLDYTLPKIQLNEPTKKKRQPIRINETRELLAETTAIAFEQLFKDYLLENTSYSREEILQNQRDRLKDTYNNAESVYVNLLLARIKEEKGEDGEISNEDIEKIIHKNNLSVHHARYMARNIIADRGNMQINKRYAVAGLLAPTIVKKYRKDKEQGKALLKRYLEHVKNNKLQEALDVFGITMSNESINKAIEVIKEQEKELYPEEEISR